MLLTADHVSFRYGDSDWLYQELSVMCESGRVIGLAGPSGSGKSTLLDLLGMTYRPATGKVTLLDDRGEVVAASGPKDLPSAGAEFAWILQSNTVLSGRSVLDNVAIAQLATGASVRDAKALAEIALARVGLGDRVRSRVNELSGGEVQRVTVARCLNASSRVVLADEPTGQLDAHNTVLVADALRQLAEDGKVVVVATHDDRVMDRCDDIVRLR